MKRKICIYAVGFLFTLLLQGAQYAPQEIKNLELQLSKVPESGRVSVYRQLMKLTWDIDSTKAELYGKDALSILERFPDPSQQVQVLNEISTGLITKGLYEKAQKYLDKAFTIYPSSKSFPAKASLLISKATLLENEKKYKEAINTLEQGLEIAIKLKQKIPEREIYKKLSDIYGAMQDYVKSLDYYKKFKEVNDSIFNKDSLERIQEMQNRYNMEKTEKQIALLKKDKDIRDLNLNRQRIFTFSIITISLFVVLVILVMYARYRLKTVTNRLLQQEISEHKQTAQKLQESEEQFRTLAEKSVVGIYITQDGLIQYVNPRFLSIFGYTEQEVIGQKPSILAIPDDMAIVETQIARRLTSNEDSINYEFQGLTKDGQIIHLESYGTHTYFQGLPAVLETVIDVTDRKRLESELVKSQKLESVGILADGIAMDFNKLLAIIVGNLSVILENNSTSPETVRLLTPAEKASLQASELVEKLITFSRGGWISPRKIEFRELTENTLNIYPEFKPIIHTISLPSDLKPLFCDERQVRHVLHSLLLNADEAMTDSKDIRINAENISFPADNPFSLKPGEYIKISVMDTGKGIPPDQVEKIFDPYFSTKNTVTQKGMGMGLAICYSILKKHNGHISIFSQVGKGTTVDIYIPSFQDEKSN